MKFGYLLLALAAFAAGAVLLPMLLKRPEEEPTQEELEKQAKDLGGKSAADLQSYGGQAYAGWIGFQTGLFGTAYGDEWSDVIAPLYIAEVAYGGEIY